MESEQGKSHGRDGQEVPESVSSESRHSLCCSTTARGELRLYWHRLNHVSFVLQKKYHVLFVSCILYHIM